MCENSSLFDRLIQELTHDLSIFPTPSQVLGETFFVHPDNRTGRETFYSVGRIHAIASLIPGLRKRYIGATSFSALTDTDRHTAAVSEFLADNNKCALLNRTLSRRIDSDSFTELVVSEAKCFLSKRMDGSQPVLTMSKLAAGLRVGPGASSDVQGDPGTYGRLCDSNITFSSPKVASLYRACTNMSPLSRKVEAVRFALHGAHDSCNTNAVFLSVPKNETVNRGICTQPSGNMALELSLHGILTDVLKHSFDCDLSTQQDLNKHLAYLGSRVTWSGQQRSWRFCTIDL